MPVTAADFWIVDEKADPWSSDPWATSLTEVLDSARLTDLISTPGPEHADLDIALALMDLVRDDLQLSGTSGGERISDGNMRLAVRALERASARAGYEFKLPLRDHAGWRSYWIRKGASGSGGWQARRDLLTDLFDGAYALLMAAQDRALDSTLAKAVSPHERLG